MNQLIFDKDNNWDIYGTDDALNCHVAVMLCRNSSVCISQCGALKNRTAESGLKPFVIPGN